jgi:hypothetical protein
MLYSEMEMTSILNTMNFAAEKYRNQKRKNKDASPYINHPIAECKRQSKSTAFLFYFRFYKNHAFSYNTYNF